MKVRQHSILAIVLLLELTSCEKNVRYSDFDGFWQVCTVENKTMGTVTNPEGRLYISFECELAKLSYITEDHNTGFLGYEYIGSYVHEGDSLRFSTFYTYHYTNPDEPIEAPTHHLEAFGIDSQPVSFALTMTKKEMTLNNATTQLKLRKY